MVVSVFHLIPVWQERCRGVAGNILQLCNSFSSHMQVSTEHMFYKSDFKLVAQLFFLSFHIVAVHIFSEPWNFQEILTFEN